MDFVTLTHYDSPVDAHLVQSKLENEGIYSILVDQNMGSLYPGISAIGGIRLQVNRADLEKARTVLQEMESPVNGADSPATIECPACGSHDIVEAQPNPGGIQGVIAIFALVLGLIFPFPRKKKYNCRNCGNRFQARG